MIDSLDHFYNSFNNVYMTLIIGGTDGADHAAQPAVDVSFQAANAVIAAVAALVFTGSFIAMPTQAAVGDEGFLRSARSRRSAKRS